MNIRNAVLFAAALLGLSACAHMSPSMGTQGSTQIAQQSPAAAATPDNPRDIVLAIANPLAPPPMHAGSNLLGYAASKHYAASQHAVSTMDALAREYGLREVAAWPIKPLGLYCAVLEPPPGVSRDKLIATLAQDARVQLAQSLQNFTVYSSDPAEKSAEVHQYNDPYVALQRGFIATSAAAAQRYTSGHGVNIAVVDTGVDAMHPDLQGRIQSTLDLVDTDARASSRDHHGTEVAGIIVADRNNHLGIVGMAPEATLSVYKACWYPQEADGGGIAHCNSFTLAKALAAVIDTPTRIVNLSLGGPPDPLLHRLLLQLLDQGRIVVTAMPPSGHLDGFPDGTPGVIVVRTSATTPAPPGVLSAPGDDILTTQPNGGYDFTSGSSMAAAHVSGIVALLLSLSPNLDVNAVHDVLLKTSKVTDGMLQVNARAAVDTLRGTHEISR